MTEIKTKTKTLIKLNNQLKPNFYTPESPKNKTIFNLLKEIKNNTLAEKKEKFLEKLKSKTKPNSYKRYLGTPLRYAGGKSLAVGHIINLFLIFPILKKKKQKKFFPTLPIPSQKLALKVHEKGFLTLN